MMPFGSLMGGVLAHFGLRVPLIVGGVIATIISTTSIKFFLTIGATAENAQ
jgi:hypothetical protein